MADVDTGIYGNLTPPNPIDQLGKMTSINNAMAQNSLINTNAAVMGQQFRANRAMGPIMQQSVGQDGNVDYDKAVTLMAQNPDTAYLAPEFMMKAFQGKGLQLDNKLKQLDVMGKEQTFFGNTAASLLPKGAGMKRGDVADAMSTLYADMNAAGLGGDGLKDRLIGFMGQLKPDGQPLYDQMQGLAMRSSGAADSLNKVTGSFQVQDLGGQKVIGYTNPINRQFIPIGSLNNSPTPSEMNAPTAITGPNGEQTTVPRMNALPMYNGGGAQINGAPGGAPGGAPAPPPGGMQAPPAAGSAPPSPPGAITTKLGPETASWLQGRGDNAVQYSKDLQKNVQDIQTQLQVLQRIQDITKNFHPGAGASVLTKMGEAAQAVGMPKTTVDKIANGSLDASQQFSKYTVQNTMNVLRQAIGGQGRLTNLEFEQFLHSNPNIDTDPRAINKILSFSQRLFQIKVAEQRGLSDWVKAGHAPADFPTAWTQKLMQRGILRETKPDDLSSDGNFPYGGKQ